MSDSSMALIIDQIQGGGNFLFIDGKGDPGLYKQLADRVRRDELLKAEKARRGVKFLPKQVMRGIYECAGVP